MSDLLVEQVVTSGLIGVNSPDTPDEGYLLENNVWIIGDDTDVLVIDAAHDAETIAEQIGDRNVHGILLTHGHEDHINAALELRDAVDALVFLHPDDRFLWERIHGTRELPDEWFTDEQRFSIAGAELVLAHTPGHTPGSVCMLLPGRDLVFSGDTLFQGGPGATRWDYSSFPQILDSISTKLFPLQDQVLVRPGHGADTLIGAERTHFAEWESRGW